MKRSVRGPAALLSSVALLLTVSCQLGPSGTPSVSTITPPGCTSPPRCIVDPVVPTPAAFPANIPVYPGSRLTEASLNPGVPVNGQSSWGLVWETLDATATVEPYFTANLNRGDWTIVLSGQPNRAYSAIFRSRSEPGVGGMLNIFVLSNVTKISIALTAGAGQNTAVVGAARPTPTPVWACGLPTGCVLHEEVSAPSAFPVDFPVYPGARLTMATSTPDFPLAGRASWNMLWETVDGPAFVTAYYAAHLNFGEWSVVAADQSEGSYSAVFNSRSDSTDGGIVGILVVSNVTRISLVLTEES